MNEKLFLERLRAGDQAALEAVIERYAAYVSTVIINRLGSFGSSEDVEELCADVFISLWRNKKSIHSTHLRGWLAAAARNSAVSYLRKRRLTTVSEEDVIIVADDNAFALTQQKEQVRYIRSLISELCEPDREVFLRYYYYYQSIAEIASEMGMNESAVKSKLMRSRNRLREKLMKGGYTCEA